MKSEIKGLHQTPLHVVFMEWYKENKDDWKMDALTQLQVDHNEIVLLIGDDFSLITVKDFMDKFNKGDNFLSWLDEACHHEGITPHFNQVQLILYLFFEWENGKKYFNNLCISTTLSRYNRFIEKMKVAVVDKDGFDEKTFEELKQKIDRYIKFK